MKEMMVPVPRSILDDIIKRYEAGLPMSDTLIADIRGYIKLAEAVQQLVANDGNGEGWPRLFR